MIPLLATTAIVGATLVNLGGGPHLANAVVVIEGERIRAIGGAAPAGAELIKLIRADGLFLLPGLVNLHVHLGLVLDEAKRNGARLPVTALVDQFYADLQAQGGNRWDTSSLIRRLR